MRTISLGRFFLEHQEEIGGIDKMVAFSEATNGPPGTPCLTTPALDTLRNCLMVSHLGETHHQRMQARRTVIDCLGEALAHSYVYGRHIYIHVRDLYGETDVDVLRFPTAWGTPPCEYWSVETYQD